MTNLQAISSREISAEALTVLAVDDEIFNLEILSEWLMDWGCTVDTAENGKQAVELLERSPHRYDAVLLDRMMPEMDGLEVLAYLNHRDSIKHIPVILQTAAATLNDIQTGINAGVRYYLTKPFSQHTMCTMVEAAVHDASLYKNLRNLLQASNKANLAKSLHQFRNIQDAERLAIELAQYCSDSSRVVTGLYELLINAVEHGILGITYQEKTELLAQHTWVEEINRRLRQPEVSDRFATVEIKVEKSEIHFLIKDNGAGFDYQSYLDIEPERAADNHGRGIALAKKLSFDRLEYRNGGNEVLAVVVNH